MGPWAIPSERFLPARPAEGQPMSLGCTLSTAVLFRFPVMLAGCVIVQISDGVALRCFGLARELASGDWRLLLMPPKPPALQSGLESLLSFAPLEWDGLTDPHRRKMAPLFACLQLQARS